MIIYPYSSETFTATGTFVAKITGLYTIVLCAAGSGGTGGQSGNVGTYAVPGTDGDGGGAGEPIIMTQSLTKDSSYTVTIGAGGAGGAGGTGDGGAGTAGTAGGDSVFDATTVSGGAPNWGTKTGEDIPLYGIGGVVGVNGDYDSIPGTAGGTGIGYGTGGGAGGGGAQGGYAGGAGGTGVGGYCIVMW